MHLPLIDVWTGPKLPQKKLHLHIDVQCRATPSVSLAHSNPPAVHDELLCQLAACQIKNTKQCAGSTIITLRGSFKHSPLFHFLSISCCVLHLGCHNALQRFLFYFTDAYVSRFPSIRAVAYPRFPLIWQTSRYEIGLTDAEGNKEKKRCGDHIRRNFEIQRNIEELGGAAGGRCPLSDMSCFCQYQH